MTAAPDATESVTATKAGGMIHDPTAVELKGYLSRWGKTVA